jgi:predicted  nucleic acid-binding Zn-ribbon protein
MIKLEMLFEEKILLEKDMKTTSDNIEKLTNDLTQMKANLNALNGALQQTNKLISVCEKEAEAKDKALKEMVAKG